MKDDIRGHIMRGIVLCTNNICNDVRQKRMRGIYKGSCDVCDECPLYLFEDEIEKQLKLSEVQHGK